MFTTLEIELRGEVATIWMNRPDLHNAFDETLIAEFAADDFNKYGCDFVWRLSDMVSGREVARGKHGMMFFDYNVRKPAGVPEAFRFLGHGTLAGIPVPLAVTALVVAGAWLVLSRSRFGRVALATGIQASVVRYSGLRLPRITAATYILVSTIAAVVGLILTSTVTVYIPSSGNAFLLNAIGATFIGTTYDRHGRPNVPGTVLGVLLLGIVANGLLLSGLNFYWQQVGTGLLIFSVLAIGFANRKAAARA